jgi:chloride channel 2
MTQTDGERQDQLLPAHKRRTGRIGSLHEFQQRALSYQEDKSPSVATSGDVNVELGGALSVGDKSDESDVFEAYRKFTGQRSASSVSLFGGLRTKAKSLRRYYRRQIKVVSFLVLLGVIGGPLNYSIRLYVSPCVLCLDAAPRTDRLRSRENCRLYDQIVDLRLRLIGYTTSVPLQFLLWASHTLFFSQLGLFITRLAPVAAGTPSSIRWP